MHTLVYCRKYRSAFNCIWITAEWIKGEYSCPFPFVIGEKTHKFTWFLDEHAGRFFCVLFWTYQDHLNFDFPFLLTEQSFCWIYQMRWSVLLIFCSCYFCLSSTSFSLFMSCHVLFFIHISPILYNVDMIILLLSRKFSKHNLLVFSFPIFLLLFLVWHSDLQG